MNITDELLQEFNTAVEIQKTNLSQYIEIDENSFEIEGTSICGVFRFLIVFIILCNYDSVERSFVGNVTFMDVSSEDMDFLSSENLDDKETLKNKFAIILEELFTENERDISVEITQVRISSIIVFCSLSSSRVQLI